MLDIIIIITCIVKKNVENFYDKKMLEKNCLTFIIRKHYTIE